MNFKSNFIIFDLETGGLKSNENPVLEVAMCILDNDLNDIDEYDCIIKPYGDYVITEGALKANGMSLSLLEEKGKEPEEVVQDIIKILKKYRSGREKPILCGHNIVKFDIPFLQELFSYCKQDLISNINRDLFIDSMWWSRLRWQESANYKLGTCCSNANIELVDAHRALADTRANKDLIRYFIQNLRTEGKSINEKRYREQFEF